MQKKLKQVLLSILIGILLFALGWGSSWYRDRGPLMQLANIKTAIQKEQASCQTFINAGSGDFSHFEYCSQFTNWAKNVPLQ